MGLVELILLVVIGAPIARGVGKRIARSGGPVSPDQVHRLEAALLATEQRLSESERRLSTAEERLDFYEKLLADPGRSRQLPG
jgi:hypothetical protein